MQDLSLLQGDALTVLKTLPSDSVHCCVTSPPYYGLRDYGTATWEGGDAGCDHLQMACGMSDKNTLGHDGHLPETNAANVGRKLTYRGACGKCGARRIDQQIGLEPTLDAYLSRLVAVFAEVKRVLHPSGVCFADMGDTRKDKQLLMVPWRLAFALQADGWFLRDIICWAKRAPMPESVTDRCTQSWEPIFMLTKAAHYFWDPEAVKEQSATPGDCRFERTDNTQEFARGNGDDSRKRTGNPTGAERNLRNVWLLSPSPYPDAHFATFVPEIPKRCILAGTSAKGVCQKCGEPWVRVVEKTGGTIGKGSWVKDELRAEQGRSQRTGSRADGSDDDGTYQVRTLGWSPGCACAAPVLESDDLELINTPTGERVGEDPSLVTGRAGMNRPRGDNEGSRPITRYEQRRYAEQLKASPQRDQMASEAGSAFTHYLRTDRSGARPVPPELLDAWLERGWLTRVIVPSVKPLEPVPATVLDPFAGSGTTLAVALELGRNAIGIELSPEYVKLAQARCAVVTPGLALA